MSGSFGKNLLDPFSPNPMDNIDFGMLAATQNFSKKSHDIEDFKLNPELRNIISKMMLSRSRDNIYELNDYMLLER